MTSLLLLLVLSMETLLSGSIALAPPNSSKRRMFLVSSLGWVSSSSWTAALYFRPSPPMSWALTSTEAELQYDAYSTGYDQLDGGVVSSAIGITQARQLLIGQAMGHVLEIGVGTGLNLPYYDRSKVKSLTLVDISSNMLDVASKRALTLENLHGLPVQVLKLDATTTDLEEKFGKDRFDSVVDTFSLCVMNFDGARRCLDQLSRVVVERYGTVLLLENAKSSIPFIGAYQDMTAHATAVVGGKGCVYNQDVAALIRSTDRLEIQEENQYLSGLFRSYVCRRKRA